MVVRKCTGPGMSETIYFLPFNETNLKSLFDKRESDKLQFVVKEEQSGTARAVAPEPNVNERTKFSNSRYV